MGTRVSVRVLYVLLGVATAFVLVFNVYPVLAYVADVGWQMPLTQPPSPVPGVDVVPAGGFRARWESAVPCLPGDPTGLPPVSVGPGCVPGERVLFPWDSTAPNGDVDAATGLPPVELASGSPMHLTFWGLRWWEDLAFWMPPLAFGALALGVIWSLWQIVRTLPTGDVFTAPNVRRVMLIGVLVGVGSPALQLTVHLAQRAVLAHSAAAGIVKVAPSFNLLPLWLGAVVLLLAEVFRQGVRMRAEVEGLV